jgi:hypothetical protein
MKRCFHKNGSVVLGNHLDFRFYFSQYLKLVSANQLERKNEKNLQVVR